MTKWGELYFPTFTPPRRVLDRYERTVAELSLTGINLQQLMVSKGYATIYEKYADPCPWANQ